MKKLSIPIIIWFSAIYALGQLAILPISLPSVSFYFLDFSVGFLIIIAVFATCKKSSILWRSDQIPLGLFIGFSFFSLVLNPLGLRFYEWFVSVSYLFRFAAYAFLYPLVFTLLRRKIIINKHLMFAQFITGIIFALLGFVQYMLYPDLRNLYYLGWDPHAYRLFSTFLDPNFAGIVLVLTIFLGIYLLDRVKRVSKIYYSLIITTLFCGLALILTYSRSSYLALILGLPFIIKKQSRKILLSIYLLLFIAIILLPRPSGEGVKLERTSTILSRISSYKQTITVIRHYPITGVGFNAYRYGIKHLGLIPDSDWENIHSGSGSDNSFLFAWATSGLGGLLSLLVFIVCQMIFSIRRKEMILFSSLFAVIVHAFFVNSLFYPWIMLWLFILIGVSHNQSMENR